MLDLFRKYGAETGKHHQYKFWQGEFHPIELNTNEMMDERMQYIHYNPVEAGIVYEPESYRYSSAIDYGTMRKGLLEIEYIE
jgi:putative transposase